MTNRAMARKLKAEGLTASFIGAAALGVVAVAWALGQAGAPLMSPHAATWLKAVLVAPAIEELFFRGVVQSGLRTRAGFRHRPWLTVGVTAVLFAAAHLFASSTLHAALVLVPACVIGWVYERTRSIGTCIVLHGAANVVWLAFWSM